MLSPLELPLSAQTAFAAVTELALIQDGLRGVADLPGGFVSKKVKGHLYWYYQYLEPSGFRRQVFLGIDSPALEKVMEKSSFPKEANQPVDAHVRSAVAHGCAEIDSKHFKVLRRLSDYGFFRVGGVLVGTHAFLAYGNLLGVKWSQLDIARTQDIDFAHPGRNLSLLLSADCKVDVPEAIESLQMGFLPIKTLSGGTGAAYLNPKDPEFRLDFLTTCSRDKEAPYVHSDLGVTLQPLKFMEYSLEGLVQCPMLSRASAVLVNVPAPERYALHKLIIAGLREGAFLIKQGKDLHQARLLLQVLRESRPWDVENAWDDLLSRGPSWRQRAKQGLEMLNKRFPEHKYQDWLKTP